MTFETTPANLSSVNSEIIYVVYDANAIDVTKQNYFYNCEIWLNGSKVHNMRVAPNPESASRGIVDVSNIIRYYIKPILKTEIGLNEWNIECTIKVREEYNGTIGAIVATSSSRIFANYYTGRIDNFSSVSAYSNNMATNRPKTIILPENCTTFYLPRLSTTTSNFTYSIDGASAVTVTPSATNTIQHVNIASANSSVVISGVTYNIEKQCYSNDAYVLHFLNKLGGFESFTFHKMAKFNYDIIKKTYNQLPYKVSNAGVVSVKDNNIMYEQISVFGSTFKEKLRLNSDLLDDANWQWLFELVASPLVYLQKVGSSTLFPIHITGTTYEVKQVKPDGLQPLTIDVEFGGINKTQAR